MIKNYISRILSCTIITALLLFSSCSSSSKGGDGVSEGDLIDSDLSADQQRYGDGNIPEASADGPFKDIMFKYDSSEIPSEYMELLRKNAKVLNSDPTLHAEIEGHCDKRGTAEYNMALGERRAKSVASALVSLGVSQSQLSTVSYGYEIPLDSRASEDAYAKNRRAHFALSRKGENAGTNGSGSKKSSKGSVGQMY